MGWDLLFGLPVLLRQNVLGACGLLCGTCPEALISWAVVIQQIISAHKVSLRLTCLN